eukprot:m.120006 g.120006  ORF g.120006 m.120006 type:complete len:249 (-) comp13332_c0_seq1:58-804(-)
MGARRCTSEHSTLSQAMAKVTPVLVLALVTRTSSTCVDPVAVAFVNASNGIPLCIHDYDSDTSGRFCAGQSPNTTERVLPVRGGTIHHNAPNPYGQCAQLCITLGYLGTAGLEYGNQCWCSNMKGVQGIAGDQQDCNSTTHGLCPGDIACGGHCRLTEFAIVCKSTGVPMSIGTILLISLAAILVVYVVGGMFYNRRKGEVGCDLLPHRHAWWQLWQLIREGCLFTAIACIGETKSSINIAYSKFEQL